MLKKKTPNNFQTMLLNSLHLPVESYRLIITVLSVCGYKGSVRTTPVAYLMEIV